jgi:hypothetical protein
MGKTLNASYNKEQIVTMITSFVQHNRIDYAEQVYGICKNHFNDLNEKEKLNRLRSFISDAIRKPKWVWNQWNIGWLTITQDFDRIEFRVLFDSSLHEPQNRILIGVNILFWSFELQLC